MYITHKNNYTQKGKLQHYDVITKFIEPERNVKSTFQS